MSLKLTLIFILLAIAANSFANTLKTTTYTGQIQEQILGDSCDSENNCNSVVKQVLGSATLSEVRRVTGADQKVTVVLSAQAADNNQALLVGADVVTLILDVANTTPLLDVQSIPAKAIVQSSGVEDEEQLLHSFKGSCIVNDDQKLSCNFGYGINSFQRLNIEVK